MMNCLKLFNIDLENIEIFKYIILIQIIYFHFNCRQKFKVENLVYLTSNMQSKFGLSKP